MGSNRKAEVVKQSFSISQLDSNGLLYPAGYQESGQVFDALSECTRACHKLNNEWVRSHYKHDDFFVTHIPVMEQH